MVIQSIAFKGRFTSRLIRKSSRERRIEVFVMNEQGARYFDLYKDPTGLPAGKRIGCWDKVSAGQAPSSVTRRLAFTLQQMKGSDPVSGRELTGSRLAWSGFGYSFPLKPRKISHEVRIEASMTQYCSFTLILSPRPIHLPLPPLGLSYIASSLQMAGHEVHLLDCTFTQDDALRTAIAANAETIIYCMVTMLDDCLWFAEHSEKCNLGCWRPLPTCDPLPLCSISMSSSGEGEQR
jgi:hypothetical protein